MTKIQSLYIRDKTLSEDQKRELRQEFICDATDTSKKEFDGLFETSLPQEVGTKNCENYIGSVEVPVGVVGPVIVDSVYISDAIKSDKFEEKKTFFIPLATTEGALVASIQRGVKVLNSGKTTVIVKKIGMSRSVVFECGSIEDAVIFEEYFSKNISLFAQFCEETSSHLKFLSHESYMRDKLLYYRFVFDTDQAMGMNMVTIALSHAWDTFKRQLPDSIWVSLLTVSGNVCTDKKDSMINRIKGRGYFVTVETKIKLADVEPLLKVDAKRLVKTHLVKNVIGSNVAGSFAQNMHVANALGAFYLATGQDIAHVVAGSEASVHFEVVDDFLYVALTLPNVSVGSVGGGTWLPKQNQARFLLRNFSGQEDIQEVEKNNGKTIKKQIEVKAEDLAVGAGIAALAGEISGLAALTTDTLASAHKKLGRAKLTKS